jgi:hypothetical protein
MSRGDLHRVTVNLIPQAWAALEDAAQYQEMNKNDTINRALQIYAFQLRHLAVGQEIHVVDATTRASSELTGLAE